MILVDMSIIRLAGLTVAAIFLEIWYGRVVLATAPRAE
jgi:hypothetical protein